MTLPKHHLQTVCIIPARLGSTRLAGKMLCQIGGVPLIVWTLRRAVASKAFDAVFVATDDTAIFDAVEAHGGTAIMTSSSHQSGTDRVHEASSFLDCKYVVNLQGDEPQIPLEIVRDFSSNVKNLNTLSLLTCVSNATLKEMNDPNVVKAVLSSTGNALYFSRSAIPYGRDTQPQIRYKHTGIYGFTRESLQHFCDLPRGRLEEIEKLEQLRALEHGMRIHCLVRDYESRSIDTMEDLTNFRQYVEKSSH